MARRYRVYRPVDTCRDDQNERSEKTRDVRQRVAIVMPQGRLHLRSGYYQTYQTRRSLDDGRRDQRSGSRLRQPPKLIDVAAVPEPHANDTESEDALNG